MSRRFNLCAILVVLCTLTLPLWAGGNYQPDRKADLTHIKAELWFDWQEKSVSGTVELSFDSFSQPFSSLDINAGDMIFHSVTDRDGNELDYSHAEDMMVIEYPKPRHEALVKIRYTVTPEAGLYFRTPTKSRPDRPTHLFTQGQSMDTHHWLPVVDSPYEMATTDFFLHVKGDYTALANGALVSKSTDKQGMNLWHYRMEKPHATYLIALVIGDLAGYTETWNGIPLEYYVIEGDQDKAKNTYRYTREMMEFFSEITGTPFPWPRYAQSTVSEYMYGGMENTTLTVLTDSTLRSERAMLDGNSDGLIAHELAHQWFGDYVTCRDWPNAWLNEGFASYYTSQWTQFKHGWDAYVFAMQDSLHSYLRNDRRYRRPIVSYRDEDRYRLFDSHAYEKGGFVLHMLRFKLGNPGYHAGIAHYLKKHAHSNVDTQDLVAALEESSGLYLQEFFDQWVYGAGHPELQVRHEYLADAGVLRLHVAQTQKVEGLTPLFDFPLDISWETSSGNFQKTLRINETQQTLDIKVSEAPLQVNLDPHGLLLGVFEHDRSRAELMRAAEYGPSSLARYRAVRDLAPLAEEEEVLALYAQVMDSDNYHKVKEAVAESLFENPKPEALDILLQGTRDAEAGVREVSVDALGSLAVKGASKTGLINTLREIFADEPSERVQASALQALIGLQADDLEALLDKAMATPSHREVIRRVALDGYEFYKFPGTVKKLKPFTKVGNSSWVRAQAVGVVATVQGHDKKTAKWLKPFLEDENYWVKRTAISILGEMSEVPEALKYLETQLAKETSRSHKRALQRAIDEHQGTAEEAPDRKVTEAKKELVNARRKVVELEERIAELEEYLEKAEPGEGNDGFHGDI